MYLQSKSLDMIIGKCMYNLIGYYKIRLCRDYNTLPSHQQNNICFSTALPKYIVKCLCFCQSFNHSIYLSYQISFSVNYPYIFFSQVLAFYPLTFYDPSHILRKSVHCLLYVADIFSQLFICLWTLLIIFPPCKSFMWSIYQPLILLPLNFES